MNKIVIERLMPHNIESCDLNKELFLSSSILSESYSHAHFKFVNKPLKYFLKDFAGKEVKITIESKEVKKNEYNKESIFKCFNYYKWFHAKT